MAESEDDSQKIPVESALESAAHASSGIELESSGAAPAESTTTLCQDCGRALKDEFDQVVDCVKSIRTSVRLISGS